MNRKLYCVVSMTVMIFFTTSCSSFSSTSATLSESVSPGSYVPTSNLSVHVPNVLDAEATGTP